jgi:short-subunit dehydrogenase
MQPTNPYVARATKLSYDVFALKQESFNKALAEDVHFISTAILVPAEGSPTTQKASIEGKEKVQAVFAARVFHITTQVILEKLSCKGQGTDQALVNFRSFETKMEGEQKVNYRYTGHFVLTFTKGALGEVKVSKIDLENERVELKEPSPVPV